MPNLETVCLNKFVLHLLQTVQTDKEEFISLVSDALIEAEQLEDEIQFLPFEGVGHGQGKRKIQIDGYSYNELDDYLSLYIVTPH